ncbi:hypothetical protein TWF106_003535 [Orbilia oligospora]|uniref:Uncharacterized protein n=1 Tax=Orbilia oligospora TaxID=2813651 RepID=A0A7C8Q7R9_ORBOL|nr:hypothetical protein TWF106_003535 [Orbilia oligospora]
MVSSYEKAFCSDPIRYLVDLVTGFHHCAPEDRCYRTLIKSTSFASSTCDKFMGRSTPTIVIRSYSFVDSTTAPTITENAGDPTKTMNRALESTRNPIRMPKRGQLHREKSCIVPRNADPQIQFRSYVQDVESVCVKKQEEFSSACLRLARDNLIESTKWPTPVTITTTIFSTCKHTAVAAIENGDFESGVLDPWRKIKIGDDTWMGDSKIVNNDTALKPNQIFKITLDPSRWTLKPYIGVAFGQVLNTCPGATYNLSFQYKVESANGSAAGLYIVLAINKEIKINLGSSNISSSWAVGTGNFVAAEGITHLKIVVISETKVSSFSKQIIYLDDITVITTL